MPRYIVRRSKNDTKVLFGRAARRVGRQPLGECLAIGNGNGTINVKNLVETDSRGSDFFELKNITHTDLWTRTFDVDRKLAGSDTQIGGHTSEASVVTALNLILGAGITRALSSVISGTMSVVGLGTEKGTDGSLSDLLDESSNTFILESGSDTIVLTHGDGTITDVDARNVGGVGNPVTSGAVSGTNLVLTLNDSSQITIDATKMINGTEAVIDLPNWYQTYANPGTGDATAGAQLGSLTPLLNTGPWYFGQSLARGEEFLFDHTSSSQSRWLGIWGGGTTYTTTAVPTSAYWTKHIKFGADDTVSYGTSSTAGKGFDLAADYTVIQGVTKFALVYDYSTNKLQLWERHIGASHAEHRTHITTASAAEDGNPVTISAAYMVLGADIPIMTKREHTWDIIANEGTPDDTTWFDGVEVNTGLRHGTALHPGEKMSTVTPAGWAQQYFAWNYTGTATGQTSVINQASTTVRATSQEYIMEDEGWTINTKSQRYNTSVQTSPMNGGKISFRYHVDNSVDLFDEDNEEVLFTKDVDFDGTPQYLHALFSGGAPSHQWFKDWTFEPFGATWYTHSASKYKPNLRFHPTQLPGGSQYSWGELMYPGQELVWNFSNTNHNTFIGIRNPANTAWVKYLKLSQTKVNAGDVMGFDIDTYYSGGYTLTSKTVSLRYDYGDDKLKFYDITIAGVETLITTATVAEDGNAIRISIAGNGLVPQAVSLRYYGWEYVHTPTADPQSWRNWRCDRPSVNDRIKTDTVMKQRRGLLPGYYMRWQTANSAPSMFFGEWKTSNATSGLTNMETAPHGHWNWGWRENTSEEIKERKGMSFNTSNTNYNGSDRWTNPAPGVTQIQLRYHASTNKIDLHDFTNNRVILTKDVDGDGSAIYMAWMAANGITTGQLTDDFFGGGDPAINTSTFSPTFTTAPSMGYDDDGILNATEMVRIDQAVAVGKRLILTPEFWGLLEDMGGVASSGPAVDGTGWVDTDSVNIGWQKANSPHVGTNIGNASSGWDAAMYMQLRGAGTNHASRIAIYSPGNAAFTARDGRVLSNNFTDLYYTFDRISSSSGRIMAFHTLAHARAGIAGTSPETTWYANGNAAYMTGNAQTLTLTGDNYLYIYSTVGNFTLPTTATDCIELITIPT